MTAAAVPFRERAWPRLYRRRPNANLEHGVNIQQQRYGVNIVLGLFSKYFFGRPEPARVRGYVPTIPLFYCNLRATGRVNPGDISRSRIIDAKGTPDEPS